MHDHYNYETATSLCANFASMGVIRSTRNLAAFCRVVTDRLECMLLPRRYPTCRLLQGVSWCFFFSSGLVCTLLSWQTFLHRLVCQFWHLVGQYYSILYYIKVCYLYEVEPFHGMCGCKTTLLQFRYDTGVRHLSGYGVIYQSLFGI